MSETDALLARARELLASADLLLAHGDHASSVSRSYYAMFMAAEAALLRRGLAPGSHRGVVAAFGESFVRDGTFAREDGRALARAHEQRVAAEYDATTLVPAAEARELLAVATAFVGKVSAFVGGTSDGANERKR
jgi:uncharacterized protein (UPF0332 family)